MAQPTQQSGSSDMKKVMISSTAIDLPEHRDLVKDACLRQGMFPVMMEHLPAAGADAIAESACMALLLCPIKGEVDNFGNAISAHFQKVATFLQRHFKER